MGTADREKVRAVANRAKELQRKMADNPQMLAKDLFQPMLEDICTLATVMIAGEP